MFYFEQKDGAVSLFGGNGLIFGGMRACAKTETTGTMLYPELVSCGGPSVTWDNGAGLSMTLSVKESKGLAVLSLDADYFPATLGETKGDNHLAPDFAYGFEIETLGGMKSLLANYIRGEFWCFNAFSSDPAEIPNETQSLIWEKEDGFTFASTVCAEKFKSDFRGFAPRAEGEKGGVTLYVWSNIVANRCDSIILTIGEGEDPYALVPDVIGKTFGILGKPGKLREERRYPSHLEYLGWCSWDAFHMDVTHDGLVAKAKEFRDKGIPVHYFIIDDMWGDVPHINRKTMGSRELRAFEAAPERFPKGLKACIQDLKSCNITTAMWHPTTGYWHGIDPEGEIAKEHGDLLVRTLNGALVHSPDFDKAFKYYFTQHSFYKDCGAEFVKVDNQSFIRNYYKNILPIGEAARNLHNAIEASVGANFDGQIINCMCMTSENFWNRPSSSVCRLSGDFQPENRLWFIKHILQCSYNSLIQGSAYYCDWDMWWSDDGQAKKNAVLRSMSGGPVYMSDELNRSVKETIMPIIYADGRIIRLPKPAVPTRDCLMSDAETSGKIFKVFNSIGENGVVAAFDLDKDEKPVSGEITLADMNLTGERYALYNWYTGEVVFMGQGDRLPLTLENYDDFRLFLAVPMKKGVGVVGLGDKYMAPATVEDLGEGFWSVKDAGQFTFVSDEAVEAVKVNGETAPVSVRAPHVYMVELPVSERLIVKIG